MTGDLLARAQLLNTQSRFVQAEALYRQALLGDVDRASALAGLAVALWGQEKLEPADWVSQDAVAEDPERAYSHFVRACILRAQGKLTVAEKFARNALSMDYHDSSYRAELAWTVLVQGRAAEALELAAYGLRMEPQSARVLRVQTETLLALDRVSEAEASVRRALAVDAEDVLSLTQLARIDHKAGRRKEAGDRFLDALRINPTYGPARSGLVDMLKQRHWFYRFVLGYRRWTPRLGGPFTWRKVAFCFFAIRILIVLGGGLLLLFLLLTFAAWTLGTLSVVLLRFHPLGRMVLSDRQRRRANFAAGLMLTAIAAMMAHAFGAPGPFWSTGFLLAAVGIPISATLAVAGDVPKPLAVTTVILVALGLWSICEIALRGANDAAKWPIGLCLLGCLVVAMWYPPPTWEEQ